MSGDPNRPHILIVDDEELSLTLMRRILQAQYEITTTSDPLQALRLIEEGPFCVVISDYLMPILNGIDLFSQIYAHNDAIQRILVTGHAEIEMAIDAVNRGKITGFLMKPTSISTIRTVVEEAVRTYMQHAHNRTQEKAAPGGGSRKSSVPHRDCVRLTRKEREVLTLLAKGYSNEEISHTLHIAIGTVKCHVTNLFSKFDVNKRAKLVAVAVEQGLIKYPYTQ
ncbi:response regulator [Heliobacterium gestii]|uniref:Stage 0 sporulation protein A homolog n=1 Tax=Heliomicrobium gestii TaxID=2699 RepID=A0A845LE72_HELGE|nr:response regulator transcription factor [Heliomicrobium gestii]MBM7868287.1 DNA-binding NarL/FixJ family response regulator [Heliomicrobium gestii]MZP44478.1 response regulator [Heliomicrobium gestii]